MNNRSVPRWRGRVWIIDLHRLSHHPWSWPLALAKDLAQLWYSSEIAGVDAEDRQAFQEAYLRENPSAGSRWLRWLVRLKTRNYRRHSRRGGQKSRVG